MSVEFSNAYQEILFENIISIIKQNFIFQTQLKIAEDSGKQRDEIQAKYDELLNFYNSVKGDLTQIENLKAKVIQNDSAHHEKQRIQTALNAQMKENLGLKTNLETKEAEITELKEYITKLEEIAPVSKLKKINPKKKIEETVEQPIPAQDLFAIKVDDGSSF